MILAPTDAVDVQRELAAMRAEVAAIRTRMQDGWLDELRAEQVRGVVRDALADSATRASFLESEWTAGYAGAAGGGAYVRAADGSASIHLTAAIQTRFVAASAYGPDVRGYPVRNTRWGMENKTVLVALSGNLYDRSITYLAAVGYTSQSNRFIVIPDQFRLVYASLRKDIGDGWAVSVGLQNVPWDIESTYIGSARMPVGDYSIFNYRFGAGKQAGVAAGWTGEWFRAGGGVFNQIDSATLQWNGVTNLSFAVAGRAEAKWGIEWDQLAGMSGTPGSAPGVVLGLGVCMSNGRAQNPQPPAVPLATPSAQGFTADARVLLGGTVLLAQYAYMRDPVGGPELGWYQGINLQASGFVANDVEAFAEACWMGDVPVEWIAQAGVNLYLPGPHAKLTVKAVVPFGGGNVNGIRSIAGGLGIAASENNASFVTQLQVRF